MKKLLALIFCFALFTGCATNQTEEEKTVNLFLDIENDMFGYVDEAGNTVIEHQYDYAEQFSEGYAVVCKDDSYMFINEKGEQAIEGTFREAQSFYKGFAAVVDEARWTLIDTAGQSIGTDTYSMVERTEYGYWLFEDQKYYVFNGTLAPCAYEMVGEYYEGYAMVKRDGKYGFVNETGEEVIPCTYRWAGNFSGGLAFVMSGEKYGYIDTTGAEAVPFVYDKAWEFDSEAGRALVMRDGKKIYIDKAGTEIEAAYDEIFNYHSGVAAVRKGYKYGIIDGTGAQIAQCIYDEIDSNDLMWQLEFHDGMAAVCRDGKWGFIDLTGTEVITCQYDKVVEFHEGFAAVSRGGAWGMINTAGEEITQFIYDLDLRSPDRAVAAPATIGKFKNGYALVYRDGFFGMINAAGEEAIPCTYKEGIYTSDGNVRYFAGVFTCRDSSSNNSCRIVVNSKGARSSTWMQA